MNNIKQIFDYLNDSTKIISNRNIKRQAMFYIASLAFEFTVDYWKHTGEPKAPLLSVFGKINAEEVASWLKDTTGFEVQAEPLGPHGEYVLYVFNS